MRKIFCIIFFTLSTSIGFAQSKSIVYLFSTINNPCTIEGRSDCQKMVFTFYSDYSLTINVWVIGIYAPMCAYVPSKFYTIKNGKWSMSDNEIVIKNSSILDHIYFSNFKPFFKNKLQTTPLYYVDNDCRAQIEKTAKWE